MKRLALLIALLFGFAMVPAATAQADEVKHYKTFTPVVGKATGGPNAKLLKPRALASNWYGWNWDHTVLVYDGTGNGRWDVDGAASKWSLATLSVVMTTNSANAHVTVTQGDANAMCGTTQAIIGCADTTVVNGEPVSATIVMDSEWADWIYTTTLVGGTLHEMGHTVGFGHTSLSNADSVMGVPIPANCNPCARTSLSSYDRAAVRSAY